ncbi:DUF3667 domain-containing protein [Thalassotalea nanhaiensis]|uniref:DUF3667 domain-containing protein n=1 Tax=Thalassotalea nanhaiensis TaxID=3065648 RepID=A0ABY9TGR1_9GAMM|nr:DUF3667 domain-containing protein [Colwelliaceae bacterium SQ345]
MSNTEIHDKKLNTIDENATLQTTCSNCQEVLTGSYCSHCGQSSESNIKYFWTVILHLLDDIFSFDSRASRTIWPLLTRPGFLTNEYILGRRVHYVPPLRLYLFISIIFFITLKFFAASENSNIIRITNEERALTQVTEQIAELEQQYEVMLTLGKSTEEIQQVKHKLDTFNNYQQDLSNPDNKVLKAIAIELVSLELRKLESNKPLSDKYQKQYTALTKQIEKVRKGEKVNLLSLGNSSDGTISFEFLSAEQNLKINNFANQLEEKATKAFQTGTGPLLQQTISKLPQLMFVLLPLFAALLKIMYMFSSRFYMEHLTVALHSHSFVFFIILQIEIIDMVQDSLFKNISWLDSILTLISVILLMWIPIYLFIMQKRVYKQGYIVTCIKYTIVGMAYTALISITAMIAFVWGLTSL